MSLDPHLSSPKMRRGSGVTHRKCLSQSKSNVIFMIRCWEIVDSKHTKIIYITAVVGKVGLYNCHI